MFKLILPYEEKWAQKSICTRDSFQFFPILHKKEIYETKKPANLLEQTFVKTWS